MIADDLVKCPLCHSFTHIENPEFLSALKNPRIRLKIEEYVAQLVNPQVEELVNAAVGLPSERASQKDVHLWNPCVPTWRRSPKE